MKTPKSSGSSAVTLSTVCLMALRASPSPLCSRVSIIHNFVRGCSFNRMGREVLAAAMMIAKDLAMAHRSAQELAVLVICARLHKRIADKFEQHASAQGGNFWCSHFCVCKVNPASPIQVPTVMHAHVPNLTFLDKDLPSRVTVADLGIRDNPEPSLCRLVARCASLMLVLPQSLKLSFCSPCILSHTEITSGIRDSVGIRSHGSRRCCCQGPEWLDLQSAR